MDTFLLSCRALGRGVEHRMLADLGAVAAERGLEALEVRFHDTGRNEPARSFLADAAAGELRRRGGEVCFRFPAAAVRELRYRPGLTPEPAAEAGQSAGRAPVESIVEGA